MAITMNTKVCKGCGQTLRKMVHGIMTENGHELTGEYGWFHQNLKVCKKEKKKQ
jgi:hypothetical protein